MQASYVTSGQSIPHSSASAIVAGQVVLLGLYHIGIAKLDFRANAAGTVYEGDLHVTGLVRMVKKTGAITKGQRLFWAATADPVSGTAGTGALSTNPNDGPFAGIAAAAAASGDATVLCDLLGHAGPTSPLAYLITDPGNAGAIPVTASGSVQIVTAGAETRTLAVPTFVGQQLAISMKTDGGDCVITVAAAINQTGNNTITLNDAADFILLTAIQSGSNYRWKVTANDGASLTTV